MPWPGGLRLGPRGWPRVNLSVAWYSGHVVGGSVRFCWRGCRDGGFDRALWMRKGVALTMFGDSSLALVDVSSYRKILRKTEGGNGPRKFSFLAYLNGLHTQHR